MVLLFFPHWAPVYFLSGEPLVLPLIQWLSASSGWKFHVNQKSMGVDERRIWSRVVLSFTQAGQCPNHYDFFFRRGNLSNKWKRYSSIKQEGFLSSFLMSFFDPRLCSSLLKPATLKEHELLHLPPCCPMASGPAVDGANFISFFSMLGMISIVYFLWSLMPWWISCIFRSLLGT